MPVAVSALQSSAQPARYSGHGSRAGHSSIPAGTSPARRSSELEADEVGVSLRNATAKVAKVTRTSGGEAQGSRQGTGKDADPWASQSAEGYSDEPPF
jgi:hypothetical protein